MHLVSKGVCFLQRHDIIKKRIDQNGHVIESRADGIGAPKVCGFHFLFFLIGYAIGFVELSYVRAFFFFF